MKIKRIRLFFSSALNQRRTVKTRVLWPTPCCPALLGLVLFSTGMFLDITVTFFYLFRCTFCRHCLQILRLLAFVFCIAHNKLLHALLLSGHFSTRFATNKFYPSHNPIVPDVKRPLSIRRISRRVISGYFALSFLTANRCEARNRSLYRLSVVELDASYRVSSATGLRE